jgi:hypothetical protein
MINLINAFDCDVQIIRLCEVPKATREGAMVALHIWVLIQPGSFIFN